MADINKGPEGQRIENRSEAEKAVKNVLSALPPKELKQYKEHVLEKVSQQALEKQKELMGNIRADFFLTYDVHMPEEMTARELLDLIEGAIKDKKDGEIIKKLELPPDIDKRLKEMLNEVLMPPKVGLYFENLNTRVRKESSLIDSILKAAKREGNATLSRTQIVLTEIVEEALQGEPNEGIQEKLRILLESLQK